jgi:hypothetical protein
MENRLKPGCQPVRFGGEHYNGFEEATDLAAASGGIDLAIGA